MVAEARFNQAKSERKVAESEIALKGAEEAVGLMQTQMQELEASKRKAEEEAEQLRELMQKGKWVERDSPTFERRPSLYGLGGVGSAALPRLFSGHVPFEEFLLFVAHLRTLRPATAQPPALTSLISLPFLARLIAEDS
jgi:Rab guanine nucleotide exchange factor SEC2